MAISGFDRAGRVCAAALIAVAALAGCGGSDPTKPGPGAETAQAVPAVTGTPTPSPTATSTATSRPEPSRTSRPTSSAGPVNAARAALGKDFRLEEAQSARIEGTDLVVTFTRLVSDSRCPTNVTCIQAGEATIAIKVTGLDGPQSFHLTTPGNAGANEKRLGTFLIQLQEVEPYPMDPADGAVPDVHAVAVLRVSRA
jgi:hypothetical protein